MTMFSETSTETFTIKNLKLTSNMAYVNGKFLILVRVYIPYERFCQKLSNGNIFTNVN